MADKNRAEALRRLDAQAKALESRAVKPPPSDHGMQAAGYGYRLMGVLIGGLFVGLGFGAIVDVAAKTGPWGMIVGVLVGFGVSIWMAVRTAARMSAEVAKVAGPARDLTDDDEEED